MFSCTESEPRNIELRTADCRRIVKSGAEEKSLNSQFTSSLDIPCWIFCGSFFAVASGNCATGPAGSAVRKPLTCPPRPRQLTRFCRKARRRPEIETFFHLAKTAKQAISVLIVDAVGCSQIEKGPLEARSSFLEEPYIEIRYP